MPHTVLFPSVHGVPVPVSPPPSIRGLQVESLASIHDAPQYKELDEVLGGDGVVGVLGGDTLLLQVGLISSTFVHHLPPQSRERCEESEVKVQ